MFGPRVHVNDMLDCAFFCERKNEKGQKDQSLYLSLVLGGNALTAYSIDLVARLWAESYMDWASANDRCIVILVVPGMCHPKTSMPPVLYNLQR